MIPGAGCATLLTKRAPPPPPLHRCCAATPSRAITWLPMYARQPSARSLSRTATPLCASCGAATGCLPITVTWQITRRRCTAISVRLAALTASWLFAGCCKSWPSPTPACPAPASFTSPWPNWCRRSPGTALLIFYSATGRPCGRMPAPGFTMFCANTRFRRCTSRTMMSASTSPNSMGRKTVWPLW